MSARPSEFVLHLSEVFAAFGDVEARRMFGGYGLFHDGLMFGLVAADELYLKADTESAVAFVERELGQFEYMKQGKATRLSYYRAPAEIFDDPDDAKDWARLAFEAALRSRKRQAKPQEKSQAKRQTKPQAKPQAQHLRKPSSQ